ncbi:structural cement protein Gp24 [Moraxella lacunata]|uniref:Uncharacterized protein n=1 Tax=Moraxella lacunata TaxID=477 RepID=A0A1V4GVS7_MORLA|nr:hypothetical protein [Moraxella lacunata]OPH36717.1 hypothetical protein B5J94_06645 [Moraxella lacunata]
MFNQALTGDNAIALLGQRVKSAPEEVLSLPLMVEPTYPVKDGSPIYLTADKKGCTTVQNATAGFVGVVVLHNIGKSGKSADGEFYQKGDVVPVMVKGKIWVEAKDAVSELTGDVGASEQGQFSTSDTPLKGLRFASPSVGTKNLTIVEILGV